MKHKKTILIASGILLLGILLWNYGFISRYNFFTAKIDIMNNNPKMVTIGLPIFSNTELNVITKKYGFKNVNFGCMVNQCELKGIDSYNAEIEKYLEKKNGVNWRTKYKKEIDSLIKKKTN